MYHFTIIDEASIENEQKSSKKQEKFSRRPFRFAKEISPLPKASIFLYRYLDKNEWRPLFSSTKNNAGPGNGEEYDFKTVKYKLRPFSLNDAEVVVNLLINRHSQAILGVKDTDLDEMVNDWTSPGVVPDELIRVLEDGQGTIIGYIDVWDISKPHVTKYILGGVLDPEFWDTIVFGICCGGRGIRLLKNTACPGRSPDCDEYGSIQ